MRLNPSRRTNSLATVILSTEAGGALAIGVYDGFRYDGSGGGGSGDCDQADAQGWSVVRFDPATLMIPALNWRTTRLFGLPLPAGLSIAIQPQRLEGHWQPGTGMLRLHFEARFRFQVLGRQAAPDLLVATEMTSEESVGRRRTARGSRLDGEGRGVLVGVARVEPTGRGWYDTFLGLPDEALAILPCRLTRQAPLSPQTMQSAGCEL